MARRCKICSLTPTDRLRLEAVVSQGVKKSILSRGFAVSRVAMWRHLKNHMGYPPDWGPVVKLGVLLYARKHAGRGFDFFLEPNSEVWNEYVRVIERAKREGSDPGYLWTLISMGTSGEMKKWFEKEARISHYGKNPFKSVMWMRLHDQKSSRGQGKIRHRLRIGHDGRTSIVQYPGNSGSS